MARLIPAFGGGTSLSKAWGLIKRFSEDIDFKVTMPPAASRNRAKRERSAYRERILARAGRRRISSWRASRAKRDENRFFSADFSYPSLFDTGRGLRPHIRVEMTLEPPDAAADRTADRLADRRSAEHSRPKWRPSSASIRSRPRPTS